MKGQPNRAIQSLEQMTEWLAAVRQNQPAAPLAELLNRQRISAPLLLDLACIDLMNQQRAGREATAVSYLTSLPDLRRREAILDLIDAELCVSRELGNPIDLEELIALVPKLESEIRELESLQEVPGFTEQPSVNQPGSSIAVSPRDAAPRESSETLDGESLDPSASFIVPLEPGAASVEGDRIPDLDGFGLRIPEWFRPEHCHHNDRESWLIRGRDSTRGDALALKVVKLPVNADSVLSKQILDACEVTTKVGHPLWVAPQVAAIQHGHLGLIRPWIFAAPWLPSILGAAAPDQLRELASIAYCIAAAHDAGAAHGAIQSSNVMRDHEGQLHLIDSVACRHGLTRWITPDPAPNLISLVQRQELDAQELVKTISLVCSSSGHEWTGALIHELVESIKIGVAGAAERIGQCLMRFADSPPSAPMSTHDPWYRGLSDWIKKDRS